MHIYTFLTAACKKEISKSDVLLERDTYIGLPNYVQLRYDTCAQGTFKGFLSLFFDSCNHPLFFSHFPWCIFHMKGGALYHTLLRV